MAFPFFFLLLLVFGFAPAASSGKIVETLPGYPGRLPFKLETGYISVGEKEEIQLFYYFIESQGNPRSDPVILWHSGGPGCSAFTGLAYEFGPLAFDLENFDSSVPSLFLREYDWTKFASIIFIDSPVGAGFSYDNTTKGYHSSDTGIAKINYDFLRTWMVSHSTFTRNPLYVGGDSYGGKVAVLVTYEIAKGILKGDQPRILLQGYMIGNSIENQNITCNGRIPYAHRMGLLSDEQYETANRACNGEFFRPEAGNVACREAIRNVHKCIDPVNRNHILEPKCNIETPRSGHSFGANPECMLSLEDDPPVNFIFMPKRGRFWCRDQNHISSYVWANDPAVQDALGIRNGTVSYWRRCDRGVAGAHDVNVLNLNRIHRFLSDLQYRALFYSGDHDMNMPFISTLQIIQQLNLTVDEKWRPWNVNGQVAGYTVTYNNGSPISRLTFATVKGAGHTAPEFKPEECYAMVERWLSSFPL